MKYMNKVTALISMLTGNIILKVLVAKQTEQKMCPCTCEYNF